MAHDPLATAIRVERCGVGRVLPLRHRVLRAGLPVEAARFEGDDEPATRHYAAMAGDEVVGCATVVQRPWEGDPGEPAWQLRGMAVAEGWRGRGVGRAVLASLEAEIRGEVSVPRLLWCNARVPAVRFYEAQGWTVMSEAFEVPTAGPHRRMVRRIGD